VLLAPEDEALNLACWSQDDWALSGILQFFKGMEQLELLVQPSDFELTSIEAPSNASNQPEVIGPILTRLKLRITFFDQDSKDGKGFGSDSEASELGKKGEPPPA